MLENPERTAEELIRWLADYFENNGPKCKAVIGISGGKDSSVCAALCVKALGKERGFRRFNAQWSSKRH